MGFEMERHLAVSEVELNSLRECRDQAYDQISKIMMFLVDWRGSVDKFETMRTDFLEQVQELALQEKKLVEDSNLLQQREKEVEIKCKRFDECSDELQMKEKELGSIKTQIRDSMAEINLREKQLNECNRELSSKKQEVEEYTRQLSSKKQELGSIKTELEECNDEIFLKKEDLSKFQKSMEKCAAELETEETKLGFLKRNFQEWSEELITSHEKLELVKKSLQEHSKKLEHKEEELQKVENLINNNKNELELKERRLLMLRKLITSSSVEIDQRHKDLEGTQKSIKDCERELDSKRKELERVQTLTEKSKRKYDLLQKELSGICYLMEKRSKELDSKELELNSIKQLIEDYSEELEDKEKQHDVIKNSVDKCSMKLKLKEKELELIGMSFKENSKKLHTEEEKLDSIRKCRENEEKELSLLKETIKHYEDIYLKVQELNAIQISIEDHRKELELEEEILKSVKLTIEESTMELMSMREEQMSIQKLSMECSKELESKQSKLDSVRTSLEGCYNELSSKEVQQGVLQVVCCEYLGELREHKTHFDSLKRTTEKRVKELQKEEIQLEGKVKKLKSMKQQFDFRQQTSEEWQGEAQQAAKQISTMFPSSQNIEQCHDSFISLSPVLQCCIVGNGSKLQMLLNEELRKNDLLHLEIIQFIRLSSDPAKLVLDAMQGFHPAGLNNGHKGFDLGVIRRSCVALLEHIAKILPQIKPHVREEAMKLAMEWKEKMKLGHENSLEALALLKLIAAYKLDCAFSVDEFQNLLEVVECKQKRDLYEALGKGIPHVDIEKSECSDSNQLCSSSANFHSNATASERSPELLLNDLVVDHDLSIDEVSAGLKFSLDPAKLVLDVMQRSYFQCWNNGNAGFDAHLMRNTVLLLEQLMKISPKISHQVKETALQQVLLWKDNISTETQNSSEVLAFLMFLAVYDLVSYFRRDDILIIVETIVHYKQAPDICRALGITDEIAGLTVNLIQRKQLLEAARFSSAFELSDKFLPQNILTMYLQGIKKDVLLSSNVNNLFQEQCKTIDKEAAALREFLECVVDCKLESVFPPENYMHYIAARKGMKARLTQPFSAPPYMVQQPLQGHMAQQPPQFRNCHIAQQPPQFRNCHMAQQPPQFRNSYMVGPSNHSHRQFFGPGKRPRLDTTVFDSYQGSIAPQYGYPGGYFHAPI